MSSGVFGGPGQRRALRLRPEVGEKLWLTETLNPDPTSRLHCRSFLGLPQRILNVDSVKPKKGTTMETIGRCNVQAKPYILTVSVLQYLGAWEV